MWVSDRFDCDNVINGGSWEFQHWTDRYLTWNPVEWASIDHIFVQASEIWLPKIDIFYSKEEGSGVVQCQECYVRLDNTGKILRGHYFAYSFPCKINVKYFPFDQQLCSLEVANWYLDDLQMDLHPYSNQTVDMSVFLPNEEWDLMNITVERRNNFYNYGFFPSLTYRISIKRKPFYYILNLILPTLIITTTAVIGYHMPATSTGVHQEKVKMGLTAVLSIFILQLGIFYFFLVFILTSAILSTSMIILLEKQAIYGKEVPRWASAIFLENWWKRDKNVPFDPQKPTYVKILSCSCNGAANNPLAGHQMSNGKSDLSGISGGDTSILSGYASDDQFTSDRSRTNPTGTAELRVYLREIQRLVERIDDNFKTAREKKCLTAKWAALADSVEKLSLYSFLVSIAVSVVLFYFHGWY